jgi:signal peptidase II
MPLKYRVALLTFAATFGLDIVSKSAINANLTYSDRIPVIEGFFYLTHVRNTGAAFGLFRDAPSEIRLFFFVGVAIFALGIIAHFLYQLAPGDKLSALALGLILGGASGNLLDRVRHGEVIDFLHFDLWGGYSWPDFNFADTWIVVGVGLLVLEMLASEGEERAAGESNESSS